LNLNDSLQIENSSYMNLGNKNVNGRNVVPGVVLIVGAGPRQDCKGAIRTGARNVPTFDF
jgi:hypothetical protein